MPPFVEAAASNEFRSVSMNLPMFRGLYFEGNCFGREEVNVGEVGGAWRFGLGKSVAIMPGFGVLFGTKLDPVPAFTFRWIAEKKWFVTEGHLVQSVRRSEEGYHESIWDGNDLSMRWRRLEVGPAWERIRFREEKEWKEGGRLGVWILRNLSVVLFVLGPGKTKFRIGLMIHPAKG